METLGTSRPLALLDLGTASSLKAAMTDLPSALLNDSSLALSDLPQIGIKPTELPSTA
jgi:hypothetical protein